MNTIKVFLGIILLILTNIGIIRTTNIIPLVILAFILYGIGFSIDSTKGTVQRIRFFCLIGLAILLFQMVGNTLIPLEQRVYISVRTFLQLASISQVVFVLMKCISPSEIISAFYFLPQTLRLLLSMTFYFIPLLVKELHTIQLIQQSRGLGNTLKSKLYAPFAFMVPLLERMFVRSEIISYTILSRGYKE